MERKSELNMRSQLESKAEKFTPALETISRTW